MQICENFFLPDSEKRVLGSQPNREMQPAFANAHFLHRVRNKLGSPLCSKPPVFTRRTASVWHCELAHESKPSPQTRTASYKIQLLHSVSDLSKTEWNSFAGASCGSPFLHYDWIRCLEQSGCASAETGWQPQHVVVRDALSSTIVAIAPAYIKHHSLGEFVFDQDWADAAYGAGILYYPKLLLAVPFTPASGRRILTKADISQRERDEILTIAARGLKQICDALGVSSVHVNFCTADEVRILTTEGFLLRMGVQYHFTNYKKGQRAISEFEKRMGDGQCDMNAESFESIDAEMRVPYRDFDDYLSEFKSKRRITIRRERNVVRKESGLNIEIIRGKDINDDLLEEMFYIYKSTIDKLIYGRQYLTLNFFKMLGECEDFKECMCLVLAKAVDDGRIVGGTFNVIGEKNGGAFYGRYWGCTEEYRYLHFEACYYAAIEYCIENGLSRMEPGAGGGDFKYMRGFEPSLTMSLHYLKDRRLSDAVERYLDMEKIHIDGAVLQMKQNSAIRGKSQTEANGSC